MKIRSQILFAQVPTAIIIFLITFLFIFVLTVINHKAESILVDNFKSILSMERLNEAAEELNSYILHHPQRSEDEIKILENKIEQELIYQEKATQGLGEEEELTLALRKKWELYKESIPSLEQNKNSEKIYKEIKKTTANIIGLNQDSIIRKKDDLSNFIIDYRLFISFSSLVGLIFGFFMSWIFTGLFLVPLNKMTEIVSQFGKTDETVLLHIKGSEEIEKLSHEFNLMTNRLEEYHQSSLGHAIEDYENLKRVFDAFPEPLLLFGDNNDIIFINREAFHLFGILGNIKSKASLFHIENTLRDSLLKIVQDVFLTKKAHIPEKTEAPLIIYKKKKKILILPFAYPIKNSHNVHSSQIKNVLLVLQDLTRQSVSELETEQVCSTFIHNFQAPLAEIQMAIHTIIQETAGPLTETQKEILYAARDKGEEIERLYQGFRKLSHIDMESS